MIFRDPITPDMQRRWFASLDVERDFYFVVCHEGVSCGLADVKSVDWTARTFVGGIFLAPDYWNTDVAVRAVLRLTDFGFFDLGLDMGLCRVLKSNTRALRFNKALGYNVVPGDATATYHDLRVDRAGYESATKGLRDHFLKAR